MSEILEIKIAVEENIISSPGVVGIGLGIDIENKPEINIYILNENVIVPKQIGGAKVNTIVTGEIKALTVLEDNRLQKFRPAPGGVSIGNYRITAGTLGSLVYDNDTEEPLILSNFHVLAGSNDAVIGEPIVQPGKHDGGILPDNIIATLHKFIPLKNNGIVDCATAKPINPTDIIPDIMGIGIPYGSSEPIINTDVIKSGRTTKVTEGRIVDINATVLVNYGILGNIVLTNQIVTFPAMSSEGDSGSILLRKSDNVAVGLLCSGSSNVTVSCPIKEVLKQLNIHFSEQKGKVNIVVLVLVLVLLIMFIVR